MTLAVVIVNFNTSKLLQECLKSIFTSRQRVDFEVLVVDNGSSDDSVSLVKRKFPQVRVIEAKENLGFSKGNNLGIKALNADYYLLLNSDTLVEQSVFDELITFAKENFLDIASCKLLNPDRSFQANGGKFPFGLPLWSWLSGLDFLHPSIPSFHQGNPAYYRDIDWVGGTAMLIGKKLIDQIGLLDENIFMYAEDVEYCLRAKKKGFKIGWTPTASIVHLGGGSLKNPSLSQRLGELKGLLYIYRKFKGSLSELILKTLIYFFVLLRVIVYLILGRIKEAKVYAQIIFLL